MTRITTLRSVLNFAGYEPYAEMKHEFQLLLHYARTVFWHWWVVLVEVILIITDVAERIWGTWLLPPLWVKVTIGFCVLIVAQYLAYREEAAERSRLSGAIEEAERKASAQGPLLVIHPEARCTFYVHINDQRRTLGVYLEFRLTVENRGERNSIIRRFDLALTETNQTLQNVGPSPRGFVLTQGAQMMLAQNWIMQANNTILVQAHNFATGILPFYTDTVIPDGVNQLHCRLTIQDTEGNTATADFILVRS